MGTTTSQTHALQPAIDFDRAGEPQALEKYESRAQLLRYPPGRHTTAIDVRVTDFSNLEIGLIYNEGLLIGQLFVVREPHITRGHTCLYCVTECEQIEDGNYRVRLRATNQLEDDPFATAPAPGVGRWMKLLYLGFALIGAVTIVKMAILMSHRTP